MLYNIPNLRVMSCSAVALHHPTGQPHGVLNAAGTVSTAGGSRSATAALFDAVPDRRDVAYIHRINVVLPSATIAGEFILQSPDGTGLLEVFSSSDVESWEFYGMPIAGGFRINLQAEVATVNVLYSFDLG